MKWGCWIFFFFELLKKAPRANGRNVLQWTLFILSWLFLSALHVLYTWAALPSGGHTDMLHSTTLFCICFKCAPSFTAIAKVQLFMCQKEVNSNLGKCQTKCISFFSLYITNVFQVSQTRWEQKIKAQDNGQKEDPQPWIQWSKINLANAWFTDSVLHLVFANANSILSITGVFLWDQVCGPQ